jgi:hypothetical protein
MKRLDTHALPQGAHMQATRLITFALQKLLQHAAARERVIQMQFVDAPHQLQVCRRCRLG